MSIALVGFLSTLSAADLATQDAKFLFGSSNVDVIAMSGAEMVQTEGQLLEILNPVLGVLTGLPIVGPLLSPLASSLGSLLGTVDGVLMGVVGLVPAVVGSALPLKVSLGLDLGALLNLNTGIQVNSALPAVIGQAASIL